MLIGSPSIYWFLLAFYFFLTKEEALSPHSSSSSQSMFVEVADCVQLLPRPLRKAGANLRPQHKIIFRFMPLTLKVRLRFMG